MTPQEREHLLNDLNSRQPARHTTPKPSSYPRIGETLALIFLLSPCATFWNDDLHEMTYGDNPLANLLLFGLLAVSCWLIALSCFAMPKGKRAPSIGFGRNVAVLCVAVVGVVLPWWTLVTEGVRSWLYPGPSGLNFLIALMVFASSWGVALGIARRTWWHPSFTVAGDALVERGSPAAEPRPAVDTAHTAANPVVTEHRDVPETNPAAEAVDAAAAMPARLDSTTRPSSQVKPTSVLSTRRQTASSECDDSRPVVFRNELPAGTDSARLIKQLRAAQEGAGEWARSVLADPRAVIFDSETTGLKDPYFVEVAVVEVTTGDVLFQTRLNPEASIERDATEVHGMRRRELQGEPLFTQIMPKFAAALEGRRVVVYNADYDLSVMKNELWRAKEDRSTEWKRLLVDAAVLQSLTAECAMLQHSAWSGRFSSYRADFIWQKLHGDHSAVGDCRTVIERLEAMAKMAYPPLQIW